MQSSSNKELLLQVDLMLEDFEGIFTFSVGFRLSVQYFSNLISYSSCNKKLVVFGLCLILYIDRILKLGNGKHEELMKSFDFNAKNMKNYSFSTEYVH